MIAIPTLRTAALTLRAFSEADWPAYAALFADPAVTRFLGAGTTRDADATWAGMARAIGQWGLRGYGLFAVEHAGRCIGHAGLLHPHPWAEPELAYTIAPEFQGRGFATEACQAVRAWAARARGIAQPVSFIRPANAASIAVAQRLGAAVEATVALMGAPALCFRHAPPTSDAPAMAATVLIDTPALHTPRLRIRAFTAGDFAPLCAIHADPAVMRHLGGGVPRDPALTWANMGFWLGGWGMRGTGYLAVTEAETGTLIGRAGIIDAPDWPEPELGYTFAAAAWGRGYASEAAGAIRDWAWRCLRPRSLYSYVKRGNAASARVAAKLGARLEGVFDFEGKPTERWVYPAPAIGR